MSKTNGKLRRAVWEKTLGHCFYCGARLAWEPSRRSMRDWIHPSSASVMHIEHKNPVIRGGMHIKENLVPSCSCCNAAKSDRTHEEYRFLLGLRTGNGPRPFAFESDFSERDYLIVASQERFFELLYVNFPESTPLERKLRNYRRIRAHKERKKYVAA